MAWEWQAWRRLDEIRYASEAKGWRPAFPERPDNEVAPLAAESGGALVKLEPGTDECLFELRDELRSPTVILQGPHNLPTPQEANRLPAERAARLAEASPPTTVRCANRPPRRQVDRRRPKAPHVERGIVARITAAADLRPRTTLRIPDGVVYI